MNIPAPLNQGQQEAANAFFAFLFSDEKEFGISGPGGVGKTHLMSHLIDTTMPHYFQACQLTGLDPRFTEIVMTATTNKAAEVLAVATQRPTSTVQSFLNLKVQDDYSTGESKLERTNSWHPHENKIIFIDECSMVDRNLLTAIHEACVNCKIVYVGDHCQLAPVKEEISPIYKKAMPFYVLTEQMRTKNPMLQAVNDQLRATVETGEFHPIPIIPGVIDLLDDEQMQARLSTDFTGQTHDLRILAYTNMRVMQFNDFVRSIRQLPDEYQVGEYLVNNTAIRLKRRMVSVEEELTILRIADQTEDIEIDEENGQPVMLTVRRMDLESRIGDLYHDVPVPVDRSHFDALKKYYQRKKNWNRYFHLKNTYPDLRQRDAATVHKSQGSSYDYTFIDLGNISTCNIASQVARMLYVAFSRNRHRIFLYGNLAEKYGGLTFA